MPWHRSFVDVSEEPTRRLRLWAAAHKSRATNDVARKQGDIGGALPYWTDDDGEQSFDDEAEEELREKLTKEQLVNRKRHLRRQETAASTRGEVDTEVKALMAKAKAGQLTLGDVDAMRERKELEYKVEQTHNVNLTTQKHARAYDHKKGENVVWEKDELAEIDLTLGRLDHAKDPDAFKEIQRTESHGIWDGVGGVHHGDSIEVRDGGATTQPGYRHGGDPREGVSDDFKRQHGDKIGTLEFVLTHEIGHDYADKHQKTFEAFKTAAGWEKVTLDALVADGVSAEDIETIQKRVENPTSKTFDVTGRTKTFNSTGTKDEYWAVPKTAIPAQDEAEPGVKGDDAWFYARANPAEHFAETYAKAVHVPEKLHEDLIVKPAEAVTRACETYEPLRRQIAKLEGDPRAQVKLANLKSIASALKAELARAEATQKQRAAEFALMRDGVFGTDKAVKISLDRLAAKHVTRDKIEQFQERAAKASTPEQVAVLEAEASK